MEYTLCWPTRTGIKDRDLQKTVGVNLQYSMLATLP